MALLGEASRNGRADALLGTNAHDNGRRLSHGCAPNSDAIDCLTLGAHGVRTGGQTLDRFLPNWPIDER